MGERCVIIGVIGGDRQGEAARNFGAAVANADCILLTGGGDMDDDEVKNASARGAVREQSKGAIARLVGILPSEEIRWEPSGCRLLLHTGLKHNLRNVINGVTPDVLVVFGGSRGTLAEAGFAATAGRQLFFYSGPDGGAVARLDRNLKKHFGESGVANTDCYLRQPLAAFPRAWPQPQTTEEIKLALQRILAQATDWTGPPAELVERCVAVVRAKGPLGPTGFPGLPGDRGSIKQFEAEIRRISVAVPHR